MPSFFLWGQLEPRQPLLPTMGNFCLHSPACLSVRGVNTIIRGWRHPIEAHPWLSEHVPTAASHNMGRAELLKGWEQVGEGLRPSQLITDMSQSELEDTFQDHVVHTS